LERKGILKISSGSTASTVGVEELPSLSPLSAQDWDQLVAKRLSGREIHNVVENVALWCTAMKKQVTLYEILQTIELTVPYARQGSSADYDGSDEDDSEESEGRKRKRARLRFAD